MMFIMKDKDKKIQSNTKQSEEDKALWHEVTKDVVPLKGKEISIDLPEQDELSN